MSMLRKITLCFILCTCVWMLGLAWFIGQIPRTPSTDARISDAIIVLTGGGGRLERGVELLADGKGKILFITGVGGGSVEGVLRHATPQVRNRLPANAASRIVLGHTAENTIGNAEETRAWLKNEGVHSIRLVTSNYHMPRSIEEFEESSLNVEIIPEPVFHPDFVLGQWWKTKIGRQLLLSEYHKFLAAKLRHWIISQVRKT